jgi:hypothetical protein
MKTSSKQPVYQAADFCALSFAVAGWARAVSARHNEMPPVPSANRSNRGTGDHTEVRKDAAKMKGEVKLHQRRFL